MNVEPQTHGLPDWQFPSPSSTPKSTATHQAPFQTPKCESTSHFLDAYYTPQVTGHQTPAATPTYNTFTVTRRPLSIRNSPLNPDDPTFHINHYKERNLPLPPVEPFRRLSSSPDSLSSPNNLQRSLSTPRLEQLAMDSFQMQTPPPTRDSSTRRDLNNGQQGVANTPGSVFQGQAATPVRPGIPNAQTPQFHTPYQYPTLQFSPDMFQYPAGGPQSAPTTQQARYPWDNSPPIGSFGNPGMIDAQQHPFGASAMNNSGFADWAHNTSSLHHQGAFQQQAPIPLSQPNQNPDFWTTGGINAQQTTSFSQDSSFVSTTSGVNPSMLFSFSSPLQTIDPSSVRPQPPQTASEASRLPYEHQTKESFREKELAKKARQPHSRTSTASSSVSFQPTARPSLSRSNTDSGFRRSQTRGTDTPRNNQILESIQRRASPLKRNSQGPLSAIPEAIRPRPRTRLVVDASGTARTEVIPVDESSNADNRKSFGRWDDDDDDTDEDVGITSQRNSFALPSESLRRRPSKHARVDSDPDRFDVSKRPVSSASISSLTSRLETTPIGKRLSGEANKRFSSGSYGGSFTGENISPAKDSNDPDETSTDALAALKKAREGRARRQEQNDPQALLNAHNQRWSQASIDVAKFSAIQEQQQQLQQRQRSYDPFADNLTSSLSPSNTTETDILTPSTDRSIRSNESTRCLCNHFENDGQLMIQCESCTKWLHVRCVGLNELNLPPVYVCIFCTGSTPVARGGRIREPVRRPESFASPLRYKSGDQYRRGG